MSEDVRLNDLLSTQVFCVEIQENELCKAELGDPTKTYGENGYYEFTKNGKFYFVVDADSHGNNRVPMDRARLKFLEELFNQEIITYKEIPSEEV